MALIRSRVHGNSMGARLNDGCSKFARIRVIGISRVPYQCNLIEIDAELNHGLSLLTEIMTTGSTGTS